MSLAADAGHDSVESRFIDSNYLSVYKPWCRVIVDAMLEPPHRGLILGVS